MITLRLQRRQFAGYRQISKRDPAGPAKAVFKIGGLFASLAFEEPHPRSEVIAGRGGYWEEAEINE
jgi:hypothetical protein